MEAYTDLVVREVLMEEHGLSRELAFDLVRRNRQQRWKQERELVAIIHAWGIERR